MDIRWIVLGGLVCLSGLILYLSWKKYDEEKKQIEEWFKENMKTINKIDELIDKQLNSTTGDAFEMYIELVREVVVSENDISENSR